MLVPFAKFVVFTLAPALVMIWCTTPDLWGCISHLFHHVGANPDQFLHIFGDLTRQAQDVFTTSENVVSSLTCDDLELVTSNISPSVSSGPPPPLPLSSEAPVVLVPGGDKVVSESTPKCAPWLLSGMILMGLDFYFPRLSAVSSLWTPLQAAIPVLHWMVSWWILPPGWEPNLFSLAPLSHNWGPSLGSRGFWVYPWWDPAGMVSCCQ
ncbi:hypothetical protein DSO57_1022349 [Entomophthora muscae]|uniref:Uncharacterized protein n=1 Tax=Entomophthora muscae TaxID=34485 RepID=A0ACC2U1J2_9FUNG|nr:hypothetical protein DSO57_1022349 [Entomophthora muscae]